MSDLKKIAILVAGLALIGAMVGTAYLLKAGPWKPRDLGPVIARVDGVPIYLSQAQSRVQGLSTVHGNVQQALGTDWQAKVLQSLVDDQIIREEADRRGIDVAREEIAASVLRIEGRFPSIDDFRNWLASQQMDLAELERRIELQALAARVYTAVTADVTVGNDEIRAYYRSHRDEYRKPDGTATSLLEVRDAIGQQLEKDETDRAFGTWLDGRRQEATVVVVLDDWWRNLS